MLLIFFRADGEVFNTKEVKLTPGTLVALGYKVWFFSGVSMEDVVRI